MFRGIAARAVVISSSDVYRAFGRLWRTEPGPPDPVPLTEESPLRERLSPDGLAYDKTGVEEELAGDGDLPVTILRYRPCMGRTTHSTVPSSTSSEWTTAVPRSSSMR